MSDSQDPRHPKSSYDPKYSYNKVTVTPSGHEIHIDDTKDRERIRIAHRSGSYSEMSADGRRVDMTVGHLIQYVKGGVTVTTDKNADFKYGGSHRTNIQGDSHSETKGTSSSAVGGDSISLVGGSHTQAVGGDSTTGVVGNQTVSVGGGQKVKVDGGQQVKVSGDSSHETGGSHTISVGGVKMVISGSGIDITGGTIRHNGRNIGDTHIHGGVEPGGGTTSVPAN